MLSRNKDIEEEDSKIGYDDQDILDTVRSIRREKTEVDSYVETRFLRDFLNALPFEPAGQNLNGHESCRDNGFRRVPKYFHVSMLEKARTGLAILPVLRMGMGFELDAERSLVLQAMDMSRAYGIDPHSMLRGDRYEFMGRFIDPMDNYQFDVMDNYVENGKFISKVVRRPLPRNTPKIKFNNILSMNSWDYNKVSDSIEEMLSDPTSHNLMAKLAKNTMDMPLVMCDPVSDEVLVTKFFGNGFFVSNLGYICNAQNYDLIIGRMQSRRYYVLL